MAITLLWWYETDKFIAFSAFTRLTSKQRQHKLISYRLEGWCSRHQQSMFVTLIT
jgi:hypothetical protein